MTTLDEMWRRLIKHQPYADKYGYGATWMVMCKTRKRRAAWDAADAAWDAADAAYAAYAAYAAAWDAARAAAAAADVAYAAADVATYAARTIRHIEEAERLYDNT